MNVRELASRVPAAPPAPPREPPASAGAPPPGATPFADALRQAREAQETAGDGLALSGHAQQRIAQRGIPMSAEDRQQMTAALDALAGKGARDALLLRADAAFVVNVPSRTVVTALDRQDMAARVFTQIDSAMLLG